MQPFLSSISNSSIQSNPFFPFLPQDLYSNYFQPSFMHHPLNSQMYSSWMRPDQQEQIINRTNKQFSLPLIPPNYLNSQFSQFEIPFSNQHLVQRCTENDSRNFHFNNILDIPSEIGKLQPSKIFVPNFGFVEDKFDIDQLNQKMYRNVVSNKYEKQKTIPKIPPNQEVGIVDNEKNQKNQNIVKINLKFDKTTNKKESKDIGTENEKYKGSDLIVSKKRNNENEELIYCQEISPKKIFKKE